MRLGVKAENLDVKDKLRYKSRLKDQRCLKQNVLGRSKPADWGE